MEIFNFLTKALFGRTTSGPEIKDGKIIDKPILATKPAVCAPESVLDEHRAKPEAEDALELNFRAKSGPVPGPGGLWIWLETAGRARRTIQEYKYEFNWWEKKSGGNIYGLKFDKIEILVSRLDASTRARKIAFLKTYAKWLLRSDKPKLYLECAKLTPPRLPHGLPRDLGEKEFIRLRSLARELCDKKQREGVWIALMLLGGLRISEIQTAQPYEKGIKVVGKGSKERFVPVPQWILCAMRNIPRTGHGKGWAVCRQIIGGELMRKIELRKPHRLRHTYAMQLLRRGRKIEEIQPLLGHSNIATTNIYARLKCPEGIVEDIEK